MKKHLTRAALALSTAAAVLLLAAPAHADWALITLGGADQAINDDAFYLLSDDGFISDSHLTAQVTILDGLRAGLEWSWAQESHDPVEGSSTALDMDAFYLTARLEHPVTSWLTPYVLGGVGLGILDMELKNSATWEQRAYTGNGMLVGGVDLHLPTSAVQSLFNLDPKGSARDFTVGFYLELGYRLTSDATFDNLTTPEIEEETSSRTPTDPTPEPIPIEDASLGVVNLSGPIMRGGLLVRF